MLNYFLLAADHHAVTTLQAPNAAAGAHVHVVNLLRCELLGARDVVNVIRIPAVDENVPWFHVGKQLSDGLINDCCRNHQPRCPRFLELFHEVLERSCSGRILFR